MEKKRWQFYVETIRSEWLDQSQSDRDVCKTLTFVFRLITENIRASDLSFILRCHIKTCILQQLLQQKLYNAAFLLQNEENTSWKRVQIIVHSKTKTKIIYFHRNKSWEDSVIDIMPCSGWVAVFFHSAMVSSFGRSHLHPTQDPHL